jgi:hypothetical protein
MATNARSDLGVAKICGHVFIVRTKVRFYGDESAYADYGRMNPLSTVFSQAQVISRGIARPGTSSARGLVIVPETQGSSPWGGTKNSSSY